MKQNYKYIWDKWTWFIFKYKIKIDKLLTPLNEELRNNKLLISNQFIKLANDKNSQVQNVLYYQNGINPLHIW